MHAHTVYVYVRVYCNWIIQGDRCKSDAVVLHSKGLGSLWINGNRRINGHDLAKRSIPGRS